MWPNRRLLELLEIDLPIIQAPMAGAQGAEMAIAVSAAGGLGSLPCAMLDEAGIRAAVARIRQATEKPFNMNFFCHRVVPVSAGQEAAWAARLGPVLS